MSARGKQTIVPTGRSTPLLARPAEERLVVAVERVVVDTGRRHGVRGIQVAVDVGAGFLRASVQVAPAHRVGQRLRIVKNLDSELHAGGRNPLRVEDRLPLGGGARGQDGLGLPPQRLVVPVGRLGLAGGGAIEPRARVQPELRR
jgi:hypothetical protein